MCHGAQPHVDGQHTVFGQTGDLDTLLKLRNGSRIKSITIKHDALIMGHGSKKQESLRP
jgi:hypothetical protein